ncbi:hypothetical protein AMC91_04815 [Elizabethkingia miricola]|nr:hypothetical protein AMC91_04815 [Elizabethkingia miricola]
MKTIVLEGRGLNKNNLDDEEIFWRLKKNKLESTRWFTRKKTSSEVFSPFCKKGKRVLDIKLEKFVYTKTHLA